VGWSGISTPWVVRLSPLTLLSIYLHSLGWHLSLHGNAGYQIPNRSACQFYYIVEPYIVLSLNHIVLSMD
jgi:hypothetical protein